MVEHVRCWVPTNCQSIFFFWRAAHRSAGSVRNVGFFFCGCVGLSIRFEGKAAGVDVCRQAIISVYEYHKLFISLYGRYPSSGMGTGESRGFKMLRLLNSDG